MRGRQRRVVAIRLLVVRDEVGQRPELSAREERIPRSDVHAYGNDRERKHEHWQIRRERDVARKLELTVAPPSPRDPRHEEEADRRQRREHDPLRGDARAQREAQQHQGPERSLARGALHVDKEQVVRQQDEEDRKDVDHPDARLDEEHPVEAHEGRGRDRKQAPGPHAQREQVHQRDAERADDGGGDAPAERVVAQVDVIPLRTLERGPERSVRPLPCRDHLLAQRRFRVEVVVRTLDSGPFALLHALDVLACEVREIDLVENLSVGRGQHLVRVLVSAGERIGEAAQCPWVSVHVDRRVRHAEADRLAAERMRDEVRRDRAEEPDEERDRGQGDQRDDIPAPQPQGPQQVGHAALADLGQRRRFRRFPPPRFWPTCIGRCAAIAHATASASGTGIAIVSS